jgi:hypothetical protein
MSREGIVGIETRLQARWLGKHGSFPSTEKRLFSYPECPQASYVTDMRLFAQVYSSQGIKLVTHLHLALRSRMHGDISPLSPYPFMACRETTLLWNVM